MADQPAVAPEPNPYDLGDTDHVPHEINVSADPPTPPAPVAAPPESDTRPRNADGTFKPAEPIAPTHPAWLVQQAVELGLADDEIAEAPTPVLTRHINRLYRERAIQHQEVARARSLSDAAVKPTQPAPVEDDLGIEPEVLADLHPSIVAVFKKQARDNRELREKLGQVVASHERVQRSSIEQQIDAGFESLPPEYKAIVGTGAMADLTEAESREARAAIYERALEIKEGSWKARIAQAARLRYGKFVSPPPPPTNPGAGAYTPPAAKPGPAPRYTAEEWAAAGLAKPTSRVDKSDELPYGEERAIKNLTRRLEENKPTESQILNGIPD